MTPRTILSVAICVIVSLVMLAIGSRYLHPHWAFATLHSLQLHAAAACIVAMIFALALYRNIVAFLLLAGSIALAAHAVIMGQDYTAMATESDANAPSVKLLSFNILRDNQANGEAIARMIAASGADVVNIMEAEPLESHLSQLSAAYPYRIGCGILTKDCDQLMLSKTPLRRGSIRSLSPIFENRFIMAETEIRGHKINIAGIHTTKPYFDEFQTVELVRATLAMEEMQGPLVLSGDFNASSLAPNIRSFFTWTGLRTASYEPPTWPVSLGAFGLPIDHVYVRLPLKIRSISTLPSAYGSNHAGLMADIVISGQ
ncbi:endonuclease/exonuclease/phosphatase family protein [Aliirhizobium smilacinae]|uniref:Endonuclease n=1 Tax=Aliirhizobium smilacinae TaxID=1395944 RepID=A0A5C4XJY8_9HYPH|nr:endonuclease/exonuclease/phosphatase family protein [Rhizobium smilacinae]TNM62990.1 endonuclease [Rhizobium smilacinae]